MSKIKHLSKEDLLAIFKLGRKLSFGDKSPCQSITTPPKTIFVMYHSDYLSSRAMNVNSGTIYFCREGDSDTPFKFDLYAFQYDGTGSAKISDVKPKKIGYHHSFGIPQFFKEQMPEKYIIKSQEYIERIKKNKQ